MNGDEPEHQGDEADQDRDDVQHGCKHGLAAALRKITRATAVP